MEKTMEKTYEKMDTVSRWITRFRREHGKNANVRVRIVVNDIELIESVHDIELIESEMQSAEIVDGGPLIVTLTNGEQLLFG